MHRVIRRAVSGHDAKGRSRFLIEGPAANCYEPSGSGGLWISEIWETAATPADNGGTEDAADHPRRLEPPPGGSIFRVISYPPDRQRVATMDRSRLYAGMGAGHAAGHDASRHPGMHKTNTIDYVVVISGEIYALMDEGEVLLRPGDCLVQRGTNHAWSNRTDEPCLLAVVLIAARPL